MQEQKAEVRSEPRWHASLAVLGAVALYITLPPRLVIGPVWVAPLLVLLVLVPLSILAPRRHSDTRRTRFASILLIAIVTFFNLASVLLLVASLFHPEKGAEHSAGSLLRSDGRHERRLSLSANADGHCGKNAALHRSKLEAAVL